MILKKRIENLLYSFILTKTLIIRRMLKRNFKKFQKPTKFYQMKRREKIMISMELKVFRRRILKIL